MRRPVVPLPLAATAFPATAPRSAASSSARRPGGHEGGSLYPLVGAAVGAVAGASVDVLAGPLPAQAAATIGVGLAALLTGGMHSTLADTPTRSSGTRERRLEIMRDHSIGAFGAVALVLVLLLEVSLLAELGSRDLALVSFAAAGALSRWSPLPIALALPSRGTTGGAARSRRDLARGRAGRDASASGNRRDRSAQARRPRSGRQPASRSS